MARIENGSSFATSLLAAVARCHGAGKCENVTRSLQAIDTPVTLPEDGERRLPLPERVCAACG